MTISRVSYSILQTPPDVWDDHSLVDQYTYTLIRSFDQGQTWHLYATMRSRGDADDLARILNWQQDLIEKAYQQGKIPAGVDIPEKEDHIQAVMDIMSEYYDEPEYYDD